MGRRRITLVWILQFLLLSACSRVGGTPTEGPPSYDLRVTEPAASPTPPPTTTPIPPTNTPEPTPIVPSLKVKAQTLVEDGQLTIDSVTTPDDSWVIIYRDMDGEPGEILGYQAVAAGENARVDVSIPPREATPTLIAQLHIDAGVHGELEYPGPDSPFKDGRDVVAETFQVDLQLATPAIDVTDQIIAIDGLITVEEVFTLQPGWLVIHNKENDKIGQSLGQAPLQSGQNSEVVIPIRWRVASTELLAVLYQDKEQPGGFDPSVDLPILDRAEPVVAEFNVVLPPDIFVYDQQLHEGKISIDRVITDGPGWVAAYYDDGGQPGLIIGFALLEDGVNEQVEVELLETAVTPRLFLILHEDTGNEGEFDFPVADLPVVYEGQLLTPVVVQTNSGNYLITKDQSPIEQNTISVPLVVADLDTWLVIYNLDETEEPDEIIGQTWLPAGIHRDIQVAINPGSKPGTLLAILHQDSGNLNQFDFPDGADVPLLRNLVPIQSPFTLIKSQDPVQPIP